MPLLDKPTSALDNDTAQLVMKLVAEWVSKRGKSIVLVNHSKKIARSYGEKLITLNSGRITQVEEHTK